MAKFFVRTAGQLLFSWSLAGVALEALTSHDKTQTGRYGFARVPNVGATHCSRELGIESSEEPRCHLLLEMDHVSDV